MKLQSQLSSILELPNEPFIKKTKKLFIARKVPHDQPDAP